jgi:hypothetical protein
MRESARMKRAVVRRDRDSVLLDANFTVKTNLQLCLAFSPLSQPSPVKWKRVRGVEREKVDSVENLEFDID